VNILFILIIVLILIVISTVKFKINPVFTLILAAILAGFLLGFSPDEIINLITEGFGKTLASIGLIIAFGTCIGVFLEKSGGTQRIAEKVLSKIGTKRAPLAMNIIGFIISIPVFCDSGFVILSSLNKALSKKTGFSILFFAIALSTGLYATHVFVPPTPGPMAAAALLDADIGLVMLLGLVTAIFVSLAGYLWARFVGKTSIKTESESSSIPIAVAPNEITPSKSNSFLLTITPLLIPIVLIALKSMANYPTFPLGKGFFLSFLSFVGHPIIALLIGVFLVFIQSKTVSSKTKNSWVLTALKDSGNIILVTGSGGAFGAVLRASNISDLINPSQSVVFGGLFIAFILAALLKTAQGSSTVAIITSAAIMAPLLAGFGLDSPIDKALSVLAIGAGAMTVSHINDSYFWVVSQFSGLTVKQTLKGHTLATLVQGLTGVIIVLLLHLFLA
jgi:gluconate:H+ symporter, GntP family